MMHSEIFPESLWRYPTVVIPGMSHASFLSGSIPQFIQNFDLRASISTADAIQQISNVTSAFITYTRDGKKSTVGNDSILVLADYIYNKTGPLVYPILGIL